MRRFIHLAYFVILLFLLSGCWNYREIDLLGIVIGMAVDEGENQKYRITVEIVSPAEGEGASPTSKFVESEGDTLFDAARNMIQYFPKRLYFAHMDVVVISESVARQGVLELVDWVNRDAEPRRSVNVLISKEKTASEILKHEKLVLDIQSFELDRMVTAQISLHKAPQNNFQNLIESLISDGIAPVLATIQSVNMDGKPHSKIAGGAIFKGEKLIGFLSPHDTLLYTFVRNQIQGGLLIVPVDSTNITLEIFKNKTKIIPRSKNGSPSVKIEIKTSVFLGEVADHPEINQAYLAKVRKVAEDYIEEEITKTIQKTQKDFGVDIFGFGSIIKAKEPTIWRDVTKESSWNDAFQELSFEVSAYVEVVNTALAAKTIKVSE